MVEASEAEPSDQPTRKNSDEENMEIIQGFMEEDFKDIRICENLGDTEYFNLKETGKDISLTDAQGNVT